MSAVATMRDSASGPAPRPPIIPASHPTQRRFGADKHECYHGTEPSPHRDETVRPSAKVLRLAEEDYALLKIELGRYQSAHITLCLTAPELRDLAARLVDAAHDLDLHPAAVLMQEAA